LAHRLALGFTTGYSKNPSQFQHRKWALKMIVFFDLCFGGPWIPFPIFRFLRRVFRKTHDNFTGSAKYFWQPIILTWFQPNTFGDPSSQPGSSQIVLATHHP
jgi:hypothetical protein